MATSVATERRGIVGPAKRGFLSVGYGPRKRQLREGHFLVISRLILVWRSDDTAPS